MIRRKHLLQHRFLSPSDKAIEEIWTRLQRKFRLATEPQLGETAPKALPKPGLLLAEQRRETQPRLEHLGYLLHHSLTDYFADVMGPTRLLSGRHPVSGRREKGYRSVMR
ncbi:MAG: hypothetical protein Kow0060_22790 [Methylohalobius crimeensis]